MSTIPKNAEEVFSGELFRVYQWPQTMFDGSTATFEMIRRRPSVNVIAVVNNTIVVLEQEQPNRASYPALPGGGIEEGEDPKTAALRELHEESGYTADDMELLDIYNQGSKIDFENYLFLAKNPRLDGPQQLDNGERIEVKLATFDAFLNLVRTQTLTCPLGFKWEMWEALIDANKKTELKNKLGLK